MPQEKLLRQFTEKTTQAFGDRLISVILYGSAASGDYQGDFSDLNMLCVLRQVSPRELRDAEPVFHWWRALHNPSPLLLSEAEVRDSTDCFPIEFHDMKERRRVLAGTDVIESLEIDDSFYRAQVEHELRAKLLRLRQKAAGAIFDNESLCRLMAESVSTFCVLIRHSLHLAGFPAPMSRTEILAEAERGFALDAEPFRRLLDVRAGNAPLKSMNGVETLQRYLAAISSVTGKVDALEK